MSCIDKSTTGPQIPPEIISLICIYLNDLVDYGWSLAEQGQAALVGKYWARLLRIGQFRRIFICSHNRARKFLELAKCTLWECTFSIASYVKFIYLKQDLHTWGWTHSILSHVTGSLLPALEEVELDLDLGTGNTSQLPRTIYCHLPRSLPPARVTRLWIQGGATICLCTARFEDAVSLISSLHSLRCIDFPQLKWKVPLSESVIQSSMHPALRRHNGCEINVNFDAQYTQSEDPLLSFSLGLAFLRTKYPAIPPQGGNPTFSEETMAVLYGLAEYTIGKCTCTQCIKRNDQ